MRLVTPEIAWHETLPIYSCDLQWSAWDQAGPSGGGGNERQPLADVTPFVHPGTAIAATGESGPLQRRDQTDGLPGWTRLATAGGDNVIRLWRVRLGWVSGATAGAGGGMALDDSVTASGGAVKNKKAAAAAALAATLVEQLAYLASLKRHEKPVNVVRWSPSGQYLASGGDDLYIVIWSRQECTPATPQSFDRGAQESAGGNISTNNNGGSGKLSLAESKDVGDEDEEELTSSTERWLPCRSFRRHLEDIYDLCWSPDGRALISGSVDHSVIVWQLNLAASSTESGVPGPSAADSSLSTAPTFSQSGSRQLIIRDHKHYVQGVTWDPLGHYMVSMSNDRACRVYKAGTRHCLMHLVKAGKQRLFQDDSWKSFFRRPAFSPDGALLVCPAGNLEGAPTADVNLTASSSVDQGWAVTTSVTAPQHAAHIFLRTNFSQPVVSLPTGARPVVAVRFCPQPFQLRRSALADRHGTTSLFDLPYRWLFCLVLEDSLLFYDTQQTKPFAMVSQFHYQALNDATWSRDGHLVSVCSTDGYCSLIHFARGELGNAYRGPVGSAAAGGARAPSGYVGSKSPTPMSADVPLLLPSSSETLPEAGCRQGQSTSPSHICLPENAAAAVTADSQQHSPENAATAVGTDRSECKAGCSVTSGNSNTCTNTSGSGSGNSISQGSATLARPPSRRVALVTLSHTKPSTPVGPGAPFSITSCCSTSNSGVSSSSRDVNSAAADVTRGTRPVQATGSASSGQKRRVSFVTLDTEKATAPSG